VIAGPSPDYGFLYNDGRDNYVVDEDTKPIVRRIFEMIGAQGHSLWVVKKILERERVPTPSGARYWSQAFLRICVHNDAYRPHSYEEVVNLVSEEVAAKLDSGRSYGIWWYGKQRHVQKQVSTIGPDGERTYHKSKRSTWNPRDKWIAVPIPDAGIPRQLVDSARQNLKENLTRKPSMAALRFWELSGGILRCGCCGWAFSSIPVSSKGKPRRYYYRCPNRAVNGLEACQMRTNYRAEKIEAQIWEIVSGILTDPEQLRADLEVMIDRERRSSLRGDPELEKKAWMDKLAETDCMRSGYQERAAKGLMTLDELAARLRELEDTRRAAERELAILKDRWETIEQLESNKDLLLDHYAAMAPEALGCLTPEERHQVYKMLRLKVIAYLSGDMEVAGDLVCIPDGGKVEESDVVEERSRSGTTSSTEYFHTVGALREVKRVRPDFSVLSGSEDLILPSLLAGADGSICAFANVAPELFVNLVAAARTGDLDKAAELHRRVLSLVTLGAYSDPAIGAIKLEMKKLGVPISPTVRGPAMPATNEEGIEAVLKDVGLLEPSKAG
jgi:hypothetical protein